MATKKYKTFADYYKSDPEFRKRHLEKLKEEVECECGFVTAKCNLARHRKNHLHTKRMENIKRMNEIKEEFMSIVLQCS
jgi:hypothetical protein